MIVNRISHKKSEGFISRIHKWTQAYCEKLLFGLGCIVLVFVCGVVVGKTGMFPSAFMNGASEAAVDWKENWPHYFGIRSMYSLPTRRTQGGVIKYDAKLAFDGLTFITAHRPNEHGGFNAYLLDMNGRVVNQWDASVRRIWPDRPAAGLFGSELGVDIQGAYLFDNGDVVLDIADLGTVRLDRCSKVLWAVQRPTHHHIEILPDGTGLSPSTVYRETPEPHQLFANVGPTGFYMDDTILRFGTDGQALEEHSAIDILLQSGWASALVSGPGAGKTFAEPDPIHINDVESLTPELASAFPMFEVGDLLISVRHLNTIFVVDPKRWQVKWLMTGPFVGQHDPDFLPNGHILVYDNRIAGATPKLGNTRLLEIDPATHKIVWSFEGTGDQQFYAKARGEQQRLPNGNILIVDPQGGRLMEIAPSAGNETVWEWVNLIEPGYVGMISDAQRVERERLPWVGSPCSTFTNDARIAH